MLVSGVYIGNASLFFRALLGWGGYLTQIDDQVLDLQVTDLAILNLVYPTVSIYSDFQVCSHKHNKPYKVALNYRNTVACQIVLLCRST